MLCTRSHNPITQKWLLVNESYRKSRPTNKWKLEENSVPVGTGLICIMHHPPTKKVFIISNNSTSGWRIAVRAAYMCVNTGAGANATLLCFSSLYLYITRKLKWWQPTRLSIRLIISCWRATHDSQSLCEYDIAEVRRPMPYFNYSVIFCSLCHRVHLPPRWQLIKVPDHHISALLAH